MKHSLWSAALLGACHRCILNLATKIPKVPAALTHADTHANDKSAHWDGQDFGAGSKSSTCRSTNLITKRMTSSTSHLNFPKRRATESNEVGVFCPTHVVPPGLLPRRDVFMMHLKLRVTGHFLHLSGSLCQKSHCLIIKVRGARCQVKGCEYHHKRSATPSRLWKATGMMFYCTIVVDGGQKCSTVGIIFTTN